MGKFTARNDVALERLIENHMMSIVDAVRSNMEPIAILLRGSFGRGEGSVAVIDGGYQFYSDYEIDVVTYSPGYRGLFKDLSRRFTDELKVETSLRWVRPDFLEKHRTGPFVTGREPISISTYESRYGSMVIFGEDFVAKSAEIDPVQIDKVSGIYLMLNRMAESMMNMESTGGKANKNRDSYYWYNKTILACAEALLLNWEKYHYSYAERGRRFERLAGERLGFLEDDGKKLSGLVRRATQYKLMPDPRLYSEPAADLWSDAIPLIDRVFRTLVGEILGIEASVYENYPKRYLSAIAVRSKRKWLTATGEKMLEVYRSLRARHIPVGLFRERDLSEVVYANVPLVFRSQCGGDYTAILQAASSAMKPLGKLEPGGDRQYLRDKLTWMWKVYCYG